MFSLLQVHGWLQSERQPFSVTILNLFPSIRSTGFTRLLISKKNKQPPTNHKKHWKWNPNKLLETTVALKDVGPSVQVAVAAVVAVLPYLALVSRSTFPSRRRTCWSHSARIWCGLWLCGAPPPTCALRRRTQWLEQIKREINYYSWLEISNNSPRTIKPIIKSGWLKKESVRDIIAVLGSNTHRYPAKKVSAMDKKSTTRIKYQI